MFAIRNLAVMEGNVPEGVLTQARSLMDTGCVVTPVRTMVMEREKRGLAKITPPTEDVQKILRKTAFNKKTGLE